MVVAALAGTRIIQTRVKLADSEGEVAAANDVVPFVIEIDREGQIAVEDRPLAFDKLALQLHALKRSAPDTPIHVACDHAASFQSLAPVLTLASSEGFTTNLLTQQENNQ